MKVRATAAASERSNAVGSIELECTPHGLAVVYLGAGTFAQGYAPGPLTEGTRVLVPWASVQEARAEGDRLLIAVDPALTPLNRLELVHFSSGDLMDEREVARQRLIVRIASAGASAIGLIVAALTVERVAPGAGAVTALAIGVLTAAAVLALGLVAGTQLGRRAEGEVVRSVLVGELATFLPGLVVRPEAPRTTAPPLALPSFDRLVPRTTLAIALTLSASLLGAVLTGRWILAGGAEANRHPSSQEPTAPGAPQLAPVSRETEPASAGPRSAAAAVLPTVSASSGSTTATANAIGEPCRCERADSLLWASPVPKLAVLVLSKRALRERRRPRTEVTVGAVNGGDKDISELTLTVQFFERDPPPSSRRYPVASRAVYYEGPLGPGQAVKWTVEARGTEFEIEQPESGHLGEHGDGAAPTNLIAELINANHRPVRMHGAMLLAYLSDPRSREATLKLREALREDEEPYLQRVLEASADLRVCQLRVSAAGTRAQVEACLFNASTEPRGELGVMLKGSEGTLDVHEPTAAPPPLVFEQSWRVSGTLLAQSGARVRATLELEAGAAERARVFEANADRYDLLRR